MGSVLNNKPISEKDKLNWLRLARSENIGPITFYQLLDYFGSVEAALENIPDMASRGGRKRPIQILSLSDAEKEYEAHNKAGAYLLTSLDPAYPTAFTTLMDAPPVLSVFGDIHLLNRRQIGIVGARNASMNGKRFAEKLAKELGDNGWIITSGLARGIDTYSHKGALPTGTIAVVAGGADDIYPPENKLLYEAIKNTGAVVSEAPFGATPKAHFFPRRNRIISGLSSGVVVVEAAQKSGSLITARFALEQGREVFAVPGSPFDPRHRGCNDLIAQGATLIQSVDDVIEGVIQHLPTGTLHESPLNYENKIQAPQSIEIHESSRKTVLENLSYAPIGVDELARQCQICTEEVLCILLELELAGKVERSPGHRIALAA